MKPVTWSVLILGAVAAGCAGRRSALSTDYPPTETAHAPQRATSQDAADDAESDAEFDLLDEKLDEELDQRAAEANDPIEGWNRAMFWLNDGLYVWVAKPVLQGYEAVVPEPARVGVSNAFHNLATPVRAVNCLLQGKVNGAGVEVHRFAINTTLGVLGVSDVARTKYQLEPVKEDLGQTLGTYGIGDGCYLVWPIFGPSTVRDSVGSLGDGFLDPVHYVPPWWLSLGISGARAGNEGSLRRGEYEQFKAESVDPYVAMRQAYMQYRSKKLKE